jgi:hypothetical protein
MAVVIGIVMIGPMVTGLIVIGPMVIGLIVIGLEVIGTMVIGHVVTGPMVIGPMVIGPMAKGGTIKGEVMGTGGIVTGVPTVPVEEKFLVIRQKVIEVVPGNVEVPESVGVQGATEARPI